MNLFVGQGARQVDLELSGRYETGSEPIQTDGTRVGEKPRTLFSVITRQTIAHTSINSAKQMRRRSSCSRADNLLSDLYVVFGSTRTTGKLQKRSHALSDGYTTRAATQDQPRSLCVYDETDDQVGNRPISPIHSAGISISLR